jgi:hypothetical protein
MNMLPVHVGDDLSVSIENATGRLTTRLTPAQAYDLAENLLRGATRRAIAEEIAATSQPRTEETTR